MAASHVCLVKAAIVQVELHTYDLHSYVNFDTRRSFAKTLIKTNKKIYFNFNLVLHLHCSNSVPPYNFQRVSEVYSAVQYFASVYCTVVLPCYQCTSVRTILIFLAPVHMFQSKFYSIQNSAVFSDWVRRHLQIVLLWEKCTYWIGRYFACSDRDCTCVKVDLLWWIYGEYTGSKATTWETCDWIHCIHIDVNLEVLGKHLNSRWLWYRRHCNMPNIQLTVMAPGVIESPASSLSPPIFFEASDRLV